MAARSIRLAQLLLFTLLCGLVGLSAAKHLDLDGPHHHQHHQHSATTHHRRRLQRDSRAKDAAGGAVHQCEAVKSYFESIDIKLSGTYSEKGRVSTSLIAMVTKPQSVMRPEDGGIQRGEPQLPICFGYLRGNSNKLGMIGKGS